MKFNKNYISLVLEKSYSDFKAEARRGSIGIAWWIIEPILYVSVFYVVFTLIFERGGSESIASLLVGLVVWKWFDSSVRQCSTCITANIGLIRQVYIPKYLLPAMVIGTNFYRFAITFIILLIALYFLGYSPGAKSLFIPLIIAIQLVLTLGIGMMFSVFVARYPDLRILVDNGMTLLFFISGIFFSIERTPEKIAYYLNLNPVLNLIELYRSILLNDQYPTLNDFTIISIYVVISMFLGFFLMKYYDKKFLKFI